MTTDIERILQNYPTVQEARQALAFFYARQKAIRKSHDPHPAYCPSCWNSAEVTPENEGYSDCCGDRIIYREEAAEEISRDIAVAAEAVAYHLKQADNSKGDTVMVRKASKKSTEVAEFDIAEFVATGYTLIEGAEDPKAKPAFADTMEAYVQSGHAQPDEETADQALKAFSKEFKIRLPKGATAAQYTTVAEPVAEVQHPEFKGKAPKVVPDPEPKEKPARKAKKTVKKTVEKTAEEPTEEPEAVEVTRYVITGLADEDKVFEKADGGRAARRWIRSQGWSITVAEKVQEGETLTLDFSDAVEAADMPD